MSTNDTNKNSKIIYPDLSYVLNGIFYKIHNQLGRFCKEKQYADALEYELKFQKIPYSREAKSSFNYGATRIGKDRIDFLVANKILVEIKAKSYVTKEDYYQTLRYLKAQNIKLGLLVNFRNTYLKAKRIAN